MANYVLKGTHMGYAISDVYGDGFRLETIFFVGDGEANNTGLRIEGFRGVEDELADAVYQWYGTSPL